MCAGVARVGRGNIGHTVGFVSSDIGWVAEQVRINVEGPKKVRDGFADNKATDPAAADEFKELDSTAARLAASYQLSDALEIYYTYDWADKDNTPSFPQYEPAGTKPNRQEEGAVNGVIYDRSENSGHALHISYEMGELTLKSITAIREMNFDDSNDYDGFVSQHFQYKLEG